MCWLSHMLLSTVAVLESKILPISPRITSTNKREYHSIVLQGLVDGKYSFRDIFLGKPGKSRDAKVFRNSPLYQERLKRSFLPHTSSSSWNINDKYVSPLILVDSAYTLAEWLMKPYFDRGNLNDVELRFNFPLTRCRVVVENIFGRLKGQFQCLLSAVVLSCITFSIIANQSSLKNGYNELTHSYFMIATLQDFLGWKSIRKASQPAFIYSKLKIRTLEQGAKYVQR